MVIIIPVLFVIALVIAFAKPKWGTYFIWLILFTYPHSWWYHHGYLPMNIGVDDIFCIVLFLAVVIHRNMIGGVPIRFGYAFWTITFFCIVAAVANLMGSRAASPDDRMLYVKDILKLGIYWGLFYAILHCIDDARDLKIQFTMFSLAAIVGGILVILHYFFPYAMEPWANPLTVESYGIQYQGRATGPFLNANGAACVLACSMVFVMTAIKLQKRLLAKIFIYGFMFILLTGVLVTESRAGLMALVGVFLITAFVGRNKFIAWMAIIAALCIALTFGGIREAYQERVLKAYDPTSGFDKNVLGRFELWKSYFQTATPITYLFGQGQRQGIIRNGGESHSLYVALITVYGMGGTIWAIGTIIGFLKKAFIAKHSSNLIVSVVASSCLLALTGWGIYAISSDAVSSQYPRYLLFYFIVLVDRAAYLTSMEERLLMAYNEDLEVEHQMAEI